MKRFPRRIFVAFALVGVGHFCGCRNRDAERHSDPSGPGPLPTVAVPQQQIDKVSKIEIQKGTVQRVVLEKRDGKWLVTAPTQSPANAMYVTHLLTNMTEIKVRDSISSTSEDYSFYELDDAKALHAMAWAGQAKVFDLYFGKSGTRGQMMRLSDRPGVWVVTGYVSYQFDREIKYWQGSDAQAVYSAPDPRVAIESCQSDCYNLWARCGAACVINEEGELCSKRCRAARAECDDACAFRGR